jgi:uroporphyrinogen-III decarboxylase
VNSRERFIATLQFGKPDRIPLTPGKGRESTRNRWYREGLPEDVSDIAEYAYRQAGGMMLFDQDGLSFTVDERMMPQFEEKIISRGERSQIVQDWKGNICEIGNEYAVEYLRNSIDFVTRRWIKCPVESQADWENMKQRYNPHEPSRFDADPRGLAKKLENRTWPLIIHFSGPFWQLREWLGFENLCMMFHDNPTFVREMIAFWEAYIAELLRKMFSFLTPDMVHLSEDMAYKNFSMISPAMVQEFILPTYKRWGHLIREAGCTLYAVDSDGFIGELIPIWIEAGINVCDPIEVAAGNNIGEFRKRFGSKMAYRGGVDKRAIAAGGRTLEAEIKRIEPIIHDGGYIPGCDHGVPHDVSWPNFVYYIKLLAKTTGWL